MNGSVRLALMANALALIAGSVSGKPGKQSPPTQILPVRVSDQAAVPPAVLRWATHEASRCFRSAKIQIAWERISVESPQDQGLNRTSAVFGEQDDRPYLFIRLVRQTSTSALPSGSLGFALPFARTGAHVVILYDRVEALARRTSIPADTILGDAMAHEIGHVLLGSSPHATAGLMQANWDAGALRLASQGLLAF